MSLAKSPLAVMKTALLLLTVLVVAALAPGQTVSRPSPVKKQPPCDEKKDPPLPTLTGDRKVGCGPHGCKGGVVCVEAYAMPKQWSNLTMVVSSGGLLHYFPWATGHEEVGGDGDPTVPEGPGPSTLLLCPMLPIPDELGCQTRVRCPNCGATDTFCVSYKPTSFGAPIAPSSPLHYLGSSGSDHASVARAPNGDILYIYHNSNGQLLKYEVRQPNGALSIWEWVNSVPAYPRLVAEIDEHDNKTNYVYQGDRLARVQYPNGVDQVWNWAPSWIGTGVGKWPSDAYSGIEIGYVDTTSAAEDLSGLTACWLFHRRRSVSGQLVTGSQPLNGDMLYRVYHAKTPALSDIPSGSPLATALSVPPNLEPPLTHEVWEYQYSNTGYLLESLLQFRADGVEPGAAHTSPVTTSTFTYAADSHGFTRLHTETDCLFGSTWTYDYVPDSADPSRLDTMTAVDQLGVTYIHHYDDYGRTTELETIPPASQRPRVQDPDNGGFAGPGSVSEKYWYEDCGACEARPTKWELWADGQWTGRRQEWAYDPTSRLLTVVKDMNPSGGTGTADTTCSWALIDPQFADSGYHIASVTDPAGNVWSYSYQSVPRASFPGVMNLGKKDSIVTETSPLITPASGSAYSFARITENDSSDPVIVNGRQSALVGHALRFTDGNGIVSEFRVDARGYASGVVRNPGGGGNAIETSMTVSARGLPVSVVEHSSSALPLTTAFTWNADDSLARITRSGSGVDEDGRQLLDRWGNVAVALRKNKTSAGGTPNDFGVPGRPDVARDWLRDEWHFVGRRLDVELLDRRALDQQVDQSSPVADAADALFQMRVFAYDPNGRLLSLGMPNQAATEFAYDGFGTLYRKRLTCAGSAPLTIARYFIDAALETRRIVEGDGADELVTLISRNSAGMVSAIAEPQVAAPGTWYPQAPAWATREFDYDVRGLVTERRVKDGASSTVVAKEACEYDECGRARRRVRKGSLTDNSADQIDALLWVGESQVARLIMPAGRYVERLYDAVGRLREVRDCRGGNPNKEEYVFGAGTDDVVVVLRHSFEEKTGAQGYVTYRTERQMDALGRPVLIREGPVGAPLVHSLAYYTCGQTESYTDPSGKVTRYLPDALGRLRELYLPGAASIINRKEYRDWTATPGRTERVQVDGRGRTTTEIFDFAGRAIAVMDPGAASEPGPQNKHVAFARYVEWDGLSRASHVYGGDGVEVLLFYDGQSRLIARMSPTGNYNTPVSFVSAGDYYVRDALGRSVASVSFLGPISSAAPLTVVSRQYDPVDRLQKESYWFDGMSPSASVDIKSTWTGGDPFRTGLEYFYGASSTQNLAMTFTPDAVGRISTIGWSPSGAATTLATYDYQGSATSRKTINYSASITGVTDFSFDAYGRQSKIETKQGATTLGKVEFFFDAASNLVKEKYQHLVEGGTPREGDRFFYDEHHRLQEAWLGADTATFNAEPPPATPNLIKRLTYALDAANNRSSVMSVEGSSSTVETYTTPDSAAPSNRYDTVGGQQYLYDERGNLTFDGRFLYVYDYLNRLSEVWTFEWGVPTQPPANNSQLAPSSSDTRIRRGDTRPRFVVHNRGLLEQCRRTALLNGNMTPMQVMRAGRAESEARRLSASIPLGTLTLAPSNEAALPPSVPPGAQPARLDPVAFYAYDGFERRAVRLVWAVQAYYYAYDGWAEVSEMVPGTSQGTVSPAMQSVWGGELDEAVAWRVYAAGAVTTVYVAEGGARSPQWLIGAAGQVLEAQQYDACGRTRWFVNGAHASSSAYAVPFGWKGHRIDAETGFLYLRHRFYDAGIGRFLSQDPIGAWADASSLGSAYCYAGNNPVSDSDRVGLQTDSHTMKLVLPIGGNGAARVVDSFDQRTTVSGWRSGSGESLATFGDLNGANIGDIEILTGAGWRHLSPDEGALIQRLLAQLQDATAEHNVLLAQVGLLAATALSNVPATGLKIPEAGAKPPTLTGSRAPKPSAGAGADPLRARSLAGPGRSGQIVGPRGGTSWRSIRKVVWKTLCPDGQAPIRRVMVRDDVTGKVYSRLETMELHHINGRGPGMDTWENLQALWPGEHAAVDIYRFTGYSVLKVY